MPGRPNRYQRIAPFYDLLDLPFEFGRYRKLRPMLFEGLGGRVLDAGVGTGRNIPFYPADTEMLGIDTSAAMLARAERRRRRLGRVVALRQMDLTRLDLPDALFDAAVASFVFCVLPEPDQVPALRERRRVLHPGGGSDCWNMSARTGGYAAPSRARGNPGWPGPTVPDLIGTPRRMSRKPGSI